ncbi:hypothetical protein BCF33_0314 [Hasllibacter halocynthiae]|uniref:Uncharacterized protein n=1 Tax=Hasllibacter halocynthiae TaxID=595589 RepID=A0A2T0X6Z7_9RHOB|nr:hypothetical protein [Hasllibacter halocynthiae]PRY94718.1 hypothetical protein BCF33_0314 [Hasllibacter halocynthiae]
MTEPKIKNADRPSEDVGLPKTGDAASGAGYLRDVDTKKHKAQTPEPAEAPDDLLEDPDTRGDHGRPD